MNCETCREGISDRLSGLPVSGRHEEMDAHLQTCATCLQEWERYALLQRLLEAVPEVDRTVAGRRSIEWAWGVAAGILIGILAGSLYRFEGGSAQGEGLSSFRNGRWEPCTQGPPGTL